MANIDIEELIKLKQEQNLTNKAIAEYYNSKGIIISVSHVYNLLRKYFWAQGQDVPKVKKEPENNISGIEIKDIAELKEKGLSYQDISDHYEGKITLAKVSQVLNEYYSSLNKNVPKTKRDIDLIPIEDILALRNKNLSYAKICEYYSSLGFNINFYDVDYKIKDYYEEKGEQIPEIDTNEITTKNLLSLRSTGMTYKQISDYFDGKITASVVGSRINRYNKSQVNKISYPKQKRGAKRKNLNRCRCIR